MQDAQALAVVLPLCAQLTVLKLTNNDSFGDAGVTAFAGAAGALPQLSELWLNGTNLGDDGLKALVGVAAAEGSFPRLTKLRLEKNKFGDESVRALASAVASSEHVLARLEVLQLRGNQLVGPNAINAMAGALRDGGLPSITNLTMSKASDDMEPQIEAVIRARLRLPEGYILGGSEYAEFAPDITRGRADLPDGHPSKRSPLSPTRQLRHRLARRSGARRARSPNAIG